MPVFIRTLPQARQLIANCAEHHKWQNSSANIAQEPLAVMVFADLKEERKTSRQASYATFAYVSNTTIS